MLTSVDGMPKVSRHSVLSLVLTSLLLACAEAPPPTPAVSGDPEQLTYAPSLGVTLDSAERRPSGLYVHDVVVGTGPVADSMMTVEVFYTGWLADGKKFESSKDRNEKFRFTLGIGQVISGWDEGIRGMRVGGTRRLIVPPKLGYGDIGSAPLIPRMATLIFDIELLGVPKASQTSTR